MPKMNGFECFNEIKKEYGKNRPKVIAVTAIATKKDEEKYKTSGMDGYIYKPIDINELNDILICESL